MYRAIDTLYRATEALYSATETLYRATETLYANKRYIGPLNIVPVKHYIPTETL